jgi:dTDP-4-dehydrorhamnose 3,5-epimerase
MPLKVESRQLRDVVVLLPQVFEDERGYFLESYHADTFKDLGITENSVQWNHSCSKKDVLRGLHFQWDPLGKLMEGDARDSVSGSCGYPSRFANGGEVGRPKEVRVERFWIAGGWFAIVSGCCSLA